MTLDAGPLIALDRDEREAWRRLLAMVRTGVRPVVPAPVITETWRSVRQVRLARALRHCRIEVTDSDLARAAGELCAAAGSDDPVDAILVAGAARRHDVVLTTDRRDVAVLAAETEGVAVGDW